MGKAKKQAKAKQEVIEEEGVVFPANIQSVLTLKVDNSNNYGMHIDNNLLFNNYIKNTLSDLKFVKINQIIKICIYGQTIAVNVLNVVSNAQIEQDAMKEKAKQAVVETLTPEEQLASDLEKKLEITSQEEEEKKSTKIEDIKYSIEKDTKIKIFIEEEDEEEKLPNKNLIEMEQQMRFDFTSEDPILLGEINDKVNVLKELVRLRFEASEEMQKGGIMQIKGVILHGPVGTGKTAFMQMISQQIDYPIFSINAMQIHTKYSGEKSDILKDLFTISKNNSPSIIFIDEIDGISSSQSDEMAIALTKLIDETKWRDKILIVGATNSYSEVNKNFKRVGRLDFEIRFDPPTAEGRFEIFKLHLNKCKCLISDEELHSLSIASSGFVGSDIASAIRDSYIRSMRKIDSLELMTPSISKEDLENAILDAKPSSIKDIIASVPKVRWDDIGGNESIKKQLKECVEWPLKYPDSFKRMGIQAPQGILLHGPPGCSKTLMAKALATESMLNFISIKGPELFSKYVGDTEKAIREIFRKARISAPCIIFFDEIDAMASKRGDDDTSVSDRALCQLLTEMDGIEEKAQVIVIAATNRIDILDKAILRPGRFDRHIEIPLPNDQAKLEILKIGCRNMPISEDVDLLKIAQRCTFFTGADCALICREAGLRALSSNLTAEYVEMCNFESALEFVKSRKK